MKYKHTQVAYLMICVLIAIVILGAYILIIENAPWYSTLISIIAVIIIASFCTLTVMIDDKYLRVKFGYGIYQKRFLLDEIVSAEQVKHHWYYGWGIRFCPKPKMWIFNVSGFDCVEIVMKNGSVYRIGTDEPTKLEKAILKSSS